MVKLAIVNSDVTSAEVNFLGDTEKRKGIGLVQTSFIFIGERCFCSFTFVVYRCQVCS